MNRINLTDGSGRWFDEEKAIAYEEDSWFDGNNHVSRATGSKYEHEELYQTASGKWIIYAWSQWQGTPQSYTEIDREQARIWLSTNNHHDALDTSDLEV